MERQEQALHIDKDLGKKEKDSEEKQGEIESQWSQGLDTKRDFNSYG